MANPHACNLVVETDFVRLLTKQDDATLIVAAVLNRFDDDAVKHRNVA